MDDIYLKKWLQAAPIRIIFPVVLTVALFVGTIFLFIIPILEDRMMEDRRTMIRELTETAWSALMTFRDKEISGIISRDQARNRAVEALRHLRYGPESKDYFWINDMHPHLIMHPYRSDLEGQDISDFTDPNGKRLFVEFVKTVRQSGAGYVDYRWQWKDNPDRIVPKISYVKGFEPWGWIIGTGIYVEDVRSEIAAITRRLTAVCIAILVLIVGLSGYIIGQSLRNERRRREAEKQAELHREQLFQADKMSTLGTLVSGVAHEINNPVSFIMLNVPILEKAWQTALPILDEYRQSHGDFKVGQMDYSRLRERIPLLLTDIAEGAERVKTIVGELKDFARQGPPEMSDLIDINAVSRKAVGLVGNLIKKSTDRFQADYTRPIPSFTGNAQKIEQVIINLLVNACQALPDTHRTVQLKTGFDPPRQRVFVNIRDEGCGMPASVLQRIRDPFFTTKRETGGTGLGLAIADRIVEDHQGQLTVESVVDKGTTVRVFFPMNRSIPVEKEELDD